MYSVHTLIKSQKDKCRCRPLQSHQLELPGWEYLCGKGLGGQGAGQEAAVYPGSKEGQEHPGLCDWETKVADYPGYYCTLVLVSRQERFCKPEQI